MKIKKSYFLRVRDTRTGLGSSRQVTEHEAYLVRDMLRCSEDMVVSCERCITTTTTTTTIDGDTHTTTTTTTKVFSFMWE